MYIYHASLLCSYCMFCTTVKLSLDATPQYNGLNTLPECQIFKICTIDVTP